jgi:tRNA(Ile)-lysidine synthase
MKKYIIAVSGGLDSITLLYLLVKLTSGEADSSDRPELDELAKLNITDKSQIIAVHVNHQIRPDSDKTEDFVRRICEQYQVQFHSTKLKLKNSSEDEARRERYLALNQAKLKFKASAIITAHNQNDAMETAIINLVRGTGWRGICALNSTGEIIRPLLSLSRLEITKIAAEANLIWHEDSTNSDESYLRNKIRKSILPKFSKDETEQLSLIINNLVTTKKDVDAIFKEIIEYSSEGFSLLRSQITSQNFSKKMLAEALIYILPKLGATYDKKVVASLSEFCLNAVNGKKFMQAGNGIVVDCIRRDKDYQLKFRVSLAI